MLNSRKQNKKSFFFRLSAEGYIKIANIVFFAGHTEKDDTRLACWSLGAEEEKKLGKNCALLLQKNLLSSIQSNFNDKLSID